MTLQNNEFDRILVELNAKVSDLQKQITQVETAKKDYINNTVRSDFLIRNSVDFANVKLEVHGGIYFIVATDDSFTYAMRLTKDQAEYLADDLDEELGKAHVDGLFQKEMVGNMINPLLKNITLK